MPDNVTFETAALEDLARALGESARRTKPESEKTLLELATATSELAKTEAKRHSKSIPPTIKVRPAPDMAIITAGNKDVPLAKLYEVGNRGKGGRGKKTFRHPVFGQDVYVEQPRFPYLKPALTAMRRQITERLEDTWKRALEPLKLH